MLTPIARSDVPAYATGRERSQRRIFANEAISEFLSVSKVGDIMEVTGFPQTGSDAQKSFASLRQAFTEELWSMSRNRDDDLRDHIRVFSRQGRLFLERKELFERHTPNPYPGDFPRV